MCLLVQAQQRVVMPLEQVKNRFRPYSGTYIPEFSGHCILNVPVTIDTTTLAVTYDLSVKFDTLVRRDRVVAEIGNRHTKFYSLYLWELSMNHTDPKRNVVYEWMRECTALLPSVIYVDKTKRQITNRVLLPYRDNFLYEYHEPLPKISWVYDSEEKEVAGYRCLKAACRFRGREWTVWYTTEIPCFLGFWKFSGLPGMILSASDSDGEYDFTAVEIRQPSTPMIRYRVPGKRETREGIRRAEKKIYGHPLDAFFAQVGQNYFVVSLNGETEIITPEDNVTIPYNPIERE